MHYVQDSLTFTTGNLAVKYRLSRSRIPKLSRESAHDRVKTKQPGRNQSQAFVRATESDSQESEHFPFLPIVLTNDSAFGFHWIIHSSLLIMNLTRTSSPVKVSYLQLSLSSSVFGPI